MSLQQADLTVICDLWDLEATEPLTATTIAQLSTRGQYCKKMEYNTLYKRLLRLKECGYVVCGPNNGNKNTFMLTDEGCSFYAKYLSE
jgi:predicted transcriptional regulator